MSTKLYYPPVGFHFDVRILGKNDVREIIETKVGLSPNIDGKFSEVSGISHELQQDSYFEGGENRFAYHLPKAVQYSPLILKRGLVSCTSAMGNWIGDTAMHGLNNPIELKHILVMLLDDTNVPIVAWLFINAYPTKWQVSGMNALQNEIMVETAEFSYHRFEKFGL
jgi:phage tail-like protein